MIFYIDTTTSYLDVALYEKGDLLTFLHDKLERNMGTKALYEIDLLFKSVKKKPQDIKKIMVVNGPGSFTGIRIGSTIAKVMAYCLKVPIITLSTLEVMAISSKEKISIPLINARRGYVYGGIYKEGKNVFKDRYISLFDLIKEGNKYGEVSYISNDLYEDIKTINYLPDFLKIIESNLLKESTPVHLVDANYLKKSEAEEKKNE